MRAGSSCSATAESPPTNGAIPSRSGSRSLKRPTDVPFLEAIRLALSQIRAHKLKSFFTLLGVTIGVMFLIAVVAVITGMGGYMEEEFAGKLMGGTTLPRGNGRSFEMNTTDEDGG